MQEMGSARGEGTFENDVQIRVHDRTRMTYGVAIPFLLFGGRFGAILEELANCDIWVSKSFSSCMNLFSMSATVTYSGTHFFDQKRVCKIRLLI